MLNFRFKLVSFFINFLESFIYNNKLKRKIKLFISDNEHFFNNIDQVHIVDCGANKGQSAIFYNSIFPSNKIYCFEANPEIFKTLQDKTLKIRHVELYNFALGNKQCITKLNACVLDEVSTILQPDFNSKYLRFKSFILLTRRRDLYKTIDVNMNTLDYFYSNSSIKSMHLLKIDVEGFEYQVLQGAKVVISKLKPLLILIEVHFDDQYQDNNQRIFELLNSLDYYIYTRIKHPFGHFYDYLFSRSKSDITN